MVVRLGTEADSRDGGGVANRLGTEAGSRDGGGVVSRLVVEGWSRGKTCSRFSGS